MKTLYKGINVTGMHILLPITTRSVYANYIGPLVMTDAN